MNKLADCRLICIGLLAAVGCAPAAEEAPNEVGEATQPSETPIQTATIVVDSRPDEEDSSDGESVGEKRDFRMGVGAVSFIAPEDWEPQQSLNAVGIALFAPDRPEWKEIGFRANLGVRTREHPGITLEELQTFLEATLAQSVEEANAAFVKHEQFGELSLQEKRTYKLRRTEIDGVRALATEFTGAYELNDKLITTQTLGLQILGPKSVYSVSLTFPEQYKEEMEPVWKAFVASVEIDTTAL